MIVGNRNAGKKVLTAVLALFVAMIVIAALVTSRRKSEPAKQPPLRPSILLIEEMLPSSTQLFNINGWK